MLVAEESVSQEPKTPEMPHTTEKKIHIVNKLSFKFEIRRPILRIVN